MSELLPDDEEVFGRIQAREAAVNSRLRATVSQAAATAPDQYADQRRMAQRLGVPPAVVVAQPQQSRDSLVVSDAAAAAAAHPVLKERFGDDDFARLAHDDSGNLAALGRWFSGAGSQLGHAAQAGILSLVGAGAKLLDDANPFTTSAADAAVLYKNDPKALREALDNSPALGLSRVSRAMQAGSDEAMAGTNAEAKARYGGLKYATLDPSEAAYLSPVKVLSDAVQSLPTSLAMGLSAWFTRGQSLRAYEAATAAGAAPAAAQAAAIAAGSRAMATASGASEGAVGYAQQFSQSEAEALSSKMENSPRYAALLAQGYAPEAAHEAVASEVAQQAGQIAGIVDTVTSAVGGKYLGRVIGEGGKLVPRMLKAAAQEATTEFVQSMGEQFGQNWAEKLGIDPNAPMLKDVLESGLQGLFVGGLTGGAMAGVLGRAQHGQQQVAQAEHSTQQLQQLFTLAAQQQLRERAPETFASMVQQMAEQSDGAVPAEVHIDAATLVGEDGTGGLLHQSEIDTLLPSVAPQLAEAMATGGSVAIPVGELMANITGTPLEAKLLPHLRATPDALSQEEAKQAAAGAGEYLQSQADQVLAEAGDAAATQDSGEKVRQLVLDQLNQANRFTPDVNEAYARLHQAFATVMGAREGLTPEQFFTKHALRVAGVNPATAGEVLNAGGSTRRERLRALHAENGVTFEDATIDRDGAHTPSGPESGSPAYDVALGGTYPEDFYSAQGLRYYGTGQESLDREVYAHLQRIEGRPNAPITIYRAVEKSAGNKIEPGAWVTPSRQYAKEHGEGALNSNYKILKATVHARDIFTSGDSMLEWGYHPQKFLPELPKTADVLNPSAGPRAQANQAAIGNNGQFDPSAPNTLRQGEQTTTPEFKAWFGDSKVVDAEGKPLVVYHGTNSDFDTFGASKAAQGMLGAGFYFARTPAAAGGYASLQASRGQNAAQNIMPVYLALKNPFVMEQLPASEVSPARLIEQGYDGIIYGQQIVAFHPEQIKSAIGNNGQFDPSDPNILHQPAGPRAQANQAAIGNNGQFDPNNPSILRQGEQTTTPEFKTWFGDSKVVDAEGKPLVVYHGTSAAFDTFNRTRSGEFGPAIYTTDNPREAGEYGAGQQKPGVNVMPLYLALRNPYVKSVDEFWKEFGKDDGDAAAVLRAENAGYDGVIAQRPDRYYDNAAGEFIDRGDTLTHYIAFHPEQIKSAIGNNGQFDPNDPNILHQDTPSPTWYSTLANQANSASMNAGTAGAWADLLKGWISTGKVKADEVEWTGLGDWLALQPGKVTKAQVSEFLAGNGVQVEETALTDGEHYLNASGNRVFDAENGDYVGSASPTKYANYQLPGGTNYRELLLTLPQKEASLPALERDMAQKNGWSLPLTDEQQDQVIAAWKQYKPGSKDYQSSHWAQPNVLAHIRVNDRTDTDGKRVLFVEELQSDWGQAGKKSGFVGTVQGAAKANSMTDAEFAKLSPEDQAFAIEETRNSSSTSIPNAPFVTSTDKWVALALKRTIKMAVDGGYDKVAFVNGEQSAARYDLSKQVRSLNIRKVGEQYALKAKTHDGRWAADDHYPAEKLEEVIGKEMAKKAIEAADAAAKKPGDDSDRSVTFEGLDLKVGGEGMKAFYDKIVPSVAKDVLKKLGGGKLTQVGLAGRDQAQGAYSIRQEADGRWQIMEGERETQSEASWFKDRAEAQKAADDRNGFEVRTGTTQPGFDITPKMRELAAGGMPLFSQGPRGTFNPATLSISLLEKADLSTFLHETGHYFLEVLADVASQENAPADVRADMGALLKWFGVKGDKAQGLNALGAWNAMTLEQKRAHHEQLAEAFEQYLMEGNAPNQELQPAFQKFRSWMLNVYKSIKDFLASHSTQLTPTVRGVFDRMLASEESIKQAEEARAYAPLFKSAAEAGMTPAEWAAYQATGEDATQAAVTALQTRSLRDMRWASSHRLAALRGLQADAVEKRKAVEAEVRTELAATPVEQARAYIKAVQVTSPEGKAALVAWKAERATEEAAQAVTVKAELLASPEGEAVRGLKRSQFLARNKRQMANEVERRALAWEQEHPKPKATPNQADIEVAAAHAGFSSGDELRQALADNPPMAELVEPMTDQRMLERFGDLPTPAGMARAADEAVHNEARARFIATGLKALVEGNKQSETPPGQKRSVNVIARAARQFAEGLVARRKLRDLRPAAALAAETRAGKKALEATAAGDTKLAITAARDQLLNHYTARVMLAAQGEVEKATAYLRRVGASTTLPPEYKDQIDKLLERFDLRKASGKALDRRASLVEWVDSQRALGIEPELPAGLLAEAQQRHYSDLTVEEFRGLVDTIKQIDHLGRLKDKLLAAKDRRDFEAARDAIAASINDNAGERQANTRTPTTNWGRTMQALRAFGAAHIKAATWARVMDGDKDGGAVWEHFIRPANTAGDFEVKRRAQATRELSDIMAPWFAEGKTGGAGRFFPEVKASFNRESLLAIALNTGNAGNLQRLLGGEGWTGAQLTPLLASLSRNDWVTVQKVWDYMGSFRPEIAAKSMRVYGVEPKWVEPTPRQVTLPDGTTVDLKGGYYPIKYDPAASVRAEEHADAEGAQRQLKGAYGAATTRRSFTKTRVDEVVGRPLLYTLAGVYSGVNDVIHDLAWHEWLIDTNRLLKSTAIDSAMREHYGPAVVRQFKTWRDAIAEGEAGATEALDVALGRLRQGVSLAGLGFNVLSAAVQPLGITQTVARIGWAWTGKGVQQYLANPPAATADVHARSEFMEGRARTQFRELNELRNRVQGKDGILQVAQGSAYWMTMQAQQIVDVPTWLGAYEKAVAEGNDDERAVALSDQAVIDSQGDGSVKDLAAIQRGGPAQKLFTVFYSFMNTALNLSANVALSPKSRAQKAADLLLVLAVPTMLALLLRNALTPGDSGDDKDWQTLVRKMLGEELSFLMGLMVVTRELAEAGKTVTGLTDHPRDYAGPSGVRLIADATQASKQIIQGEFDDQLRKSMINLIGDAVGLPSAQINRSITGVQALREGKTKNPLAAVFGYQEPQ